MAARSKSLPASRDDRRHELDLGVGPHTRADLMHRHGRGEHASLMKWNADHRRDVGGAIRGLVCRREPRIVRRIRDDVRHVVAHRARARLAECRDLPAADDARHAARPVADDVEHALVVDVCVRATVDLQLLGE